MRLLLLTSDLLLVSSAQGIAQRHGFRLSPASTAEALLKACDSGDAALAVIDLRTPGVVIDELAPQLRQSMPREALIVACAPHVHTQSLAAAAAGGCDEVLTRGQFDARLNGLLGEFKGRADSPHGRRP
jgi:CheY-like chemotaxis protein